MVELIIVANPFEPQKQERKELYYTRGNIASYTDVDGFDIILNGKLVENPDLVIPQDGDQIITMPHVGGKGIGKILGFAAMIALTVASHGAFAHGWAAVGIKGATFAAGLLSGAIMFVGGKLINSIFPQQNNSLSYNDHETSQSYGWDLPTPSTLAGNIVGETYGECIPAPQLLEQHVETVNNKQYLNLLYCGGYGPVDSIDNIRIDYTDIHNFKGVEIETRLGTNTQAPISFFKNTPLDQSVGIELSTENPTIRTSDSTQASSLEVTLEWPGGLFYINDNNDYSNATVKLRLEYRLKGSTEWTNFNTDGLDTSVTAGTNEAVRRTFSVTGLEKGQYDVRVTLVDRPHTTRYQTTTNWTLLTSYIDGIYSRPNKVLVALRILASNQLSNGVPSINWRQKRSTVYVWDVELERYVEKAADNPIWAAYDILHHCRYLQNPRTNEWEYVVDGVPKEALSAYYDQWESAAEYADELVTNQDGEKEARFRFDAFFDTTQKRMAAAQKAATIGHASIVPHGRNYGIVVDRPGMITQIFGEGRTTVSSVKGSFSSKEDRARAIEVTYSDSQNDFKNTVFTVRSPNYNTDGISDNTAQLSLFGVKRRSQAYREAVQALATNERQIQSLELNADIDAIVAEYGDIIGYNHTVSRIGVASGRIVSAEGNQLVLDKDVTLDADKTYEVYIQLSTDLLIKREVVKDTYNGNTLLLTTPFDNGQVPEKYDNYALGEIGKAVKPFRIVSASRSGDLLVSLKLMEYDEAIYSDELDYSKYPVIDYTSESIKATIRTLEAKEQSYTSNATAISDIVVNWTISDRGRVPDSYVVEIVSQSSAYTDSITTKLTSCRFHAVKPGETYDVTVRAVYDTITIGAVATTVYIAGKEIPVGNVSGLIAVPQQAGFQLSWTAPTGVSDVRYDVRYGTAGTSIEACQLIAEKQENTACFVSVTGEGQYIFWVTAYDVEGNTLGVPISTVGVRSLPEPVTNAKAETIYRHYSDGSTGYDIIVTFSLPDGADTCLVYYKTNSTSMTDLQVIPEGVVAEEIGYVADWKYAGDGINRIVLPAAQLGDTYQLKLLSKDGYGLLTDDSSAVYLHVKIEAKSEVPNTPQNFSYDFSNGFVFTWDDVTNTDIDYYELRTNQSAGSSSGLLAKCNGSPCTLNLTDRAQTVYLFARNTGGLYSYPASVTYRMEKPDAPITVVFTELPRGVRINVNAFPENVSLIRAYIEGANANCVVESPNAQFEYHGDPDVYTVRLVFVDVFGEGYMSAEYTFTINPTFNSDWIADGSLGISKMDAAINEAVEQTKSSAKDILAINSSITELSKADGEIKSTVTDLATNTGSQIKQLSDTVNITIADAQKNLASSINAQADRITSIITNLNRDGSAYSAIAQLSDGINLRVKKDDIINQINLTAQGTTIDGKYLHVTGDTKFDNNVIVGGMIKAGAITADKLSASTIALTNQQGIKGGAVTLDKSGLTCVSSSGESTVFNDSGMSFKDSNGNTYANVGRMMMGEASDGQYVKFAVPWTSTPKVFLAESSLQSTFPIYQGSIIYNAFYASDVSKNGFRVNCHSLMKQGSTGSISINKQIENHLSDARSAETVEQEYELDISNITNDTAILTFSISDDIYLWDEYNEGEDGVYGDQQTQWTESVFSIVADGTVVYSLETNGIDYNNANLTTEIKLAGVKKLTAKFKSSIAGSKNQNNPLDATCNLKTWSYTLTADKKVSTGKAMFIAIDKNNASYSLQ